MRPDNTDHQDALKSLMAKAWEDPPEDLQQNLLAIPAKAGRRRISTLDPLASVLNTLLILWGVGLGVTFWEPIESSLLTFSRSILGLSGQSPHLLSQPILGLIALGVVVMGWIWLDLDKHPRET